MGEDMFKPPIVRNIGSSLNKPLFTKRIPLTAARIHNPKRISETRQILTRTKELLRVDRISSVVEDPDVDLRKLGRKCLLLQPQVKVDSEGTWSHELKELVSKEEVAIVDFQLELGYEYWSYLDIMKSILPEDALDEIPVGFAIVGHIAHLNLRDAYLPYKHLIAEILLDKNPTVRTVINKIDNVGDESQFRTFSYEVLAGPDDMNVTLKEEDCMFQFDYSKVYWNSRLQTEHKRLVDIFDKGEMVCDTMAGIGPFAVPAGKKGVFVWANDLNPESVEAMKVAIQLNKVSTYVRPHCEDASAFIYKTAQNLLSLHATGQNVITLPSKPPRKSRNSTSPPRVAPSPQTITIPQTISHFVMNLPATAIEFLPAFKGLYNSNEDLFEPITNTKLPMVHCHCFSTKSDDNKREGEEITKRCGEMLGVELKYCHQKSMKLLEDREVMVVDVRDVAPNKRMFCATFRVPRAVAFGKKAA